MYQRDVSTSLDDVQPFGRPTGQSYLKSPVTAAWPYRPFLIDFYPLVFFRSAFDWFFFQTLISPSIKAELPHSNKSLQKWKAQQGRQRHRVYELFFILISTFGNVLC